MAGVPQTLEVKIELVGLDQFKRDVKKVHKIVKRLAKAEGLLAKIEDDYSD